MSKTSSPLRNLLKGRGFFQYVDKFEQQRRAIYFHLMMIKTGLTVIREKHYKEKHLRQKTRTRFDNYINSITWLTIILFASLFNP